MCSISVSKRDYIYTMKREALVAPGEDGGKNNINSTRLFSLFLPPKCYLKAWGQTPPPNNIELTIILVVDYPDIIRGVFMFF